MHYVNHRAESAGLQHKDGAGAEQHQPNWGVHHLEAGNKLPHSVEHQRNSDHVPALKLDMRAAIEGTAEQHRGEQLWARNKADRVLSENGVLGCAISVKDILNEAGIGPFHAGNVGGILSEAHRKGWKQVPESEPLKPGDMVIGFDPSHNWRAGGGHAHIGLADSSGNVFNNSKRQNHTWESEPIDVAFNRDDYPKRMILRPPS